MPKHQSCQLPNDTKSRLPIPSPFCWMTLQVMQKRALDNPKIKVMWDSVIEEAYGNERVRAPKHAELYALCVMQVGSWQLAYLYHNR